ncbi:MAG TPA: hypothetical protein VGN57_06635 [Pirellulaceae bacterium]|jgi:hypothetical protein|nr:hypothetical protein [Pirellulaceae bacterium]
MRPLRVWEVALAYFVLVFGAGALFGAVRVLAVEPELGARNAELVEAPFLLAAILLSGWIASGACQECDLRTFFGISAAATALLLLADLSVGMRFRGLTPAEIFLGRDPLSSALYYGLLAAYAVAPVLFAALRRRRRNRDPAR